MAIEPLLTGHRPDSVFHKLGQIHHNKDNFHSIVSEALERGVRNGEFSSDMNTSEIASFIFTFLSGLKVTSKVEQSPKALMDMIEVAMKVLD